MKIEGVLLLDGAMGTMLQSRGLPPGELPELFNLSHPDVVTDIHRAYAQAGSDVITANTFGANRLKMAGRAGVPEVIYAAVSCARKAGAGRVALDVGPLGQLMSPMGTLEFEQAYDLFREQMVEGERAGADLVIIETLSDLYEMKAAILAAKENTKLPVLATMTFQQDGRTFLGVHPLSALLTMQGLGADAVGVNCSLGPKELSPIVSAFLKHSRVPVMVQANAGLPEMADGVACYKITPDEFADEALRMVRQGVSVVGGCCGTNPDFIRAIKAKLTGVAPGARSIQPICACASPSIPLILDGRTTLIGERINPTNRADLQDALRNGELDALVDEAIEQADAGAHALDINLSLPDIDEPVLMTEAVREIQAMCRLPLCIDSANPVVLEAGARATSGRPILNSCTGIQASMDAVFPIAKKYGALVVCLTLDERGLPESAEERLRIARRLVAEAEKHGIPKQDLLIDCLALSAATSPAQAQETLRAVALIKHELHVMTVLGISNVSHGLPGRGALNATFLSSALGAGLDAAILNPLSAEVMDAHAAWRVLSGQDADCEGYIARNRA